MTTLHVRESQVIGSKVKGSNDVVEFLKQYLKNADQESFWVIGMDTEHKVLICEMVFLGGMDCCTVDPRILFRRLIVGECASFIIAHNHPSGCTTPSREDVNLTNKLREGGSLLGLKLLDHILIAGEHIVSVE